MSVNFDNSELEAFAAELGKTAAEVGRRLRPVVSKGALNIRNDMNRDLARSTHFGQIAGTVTYDLLDDGMTAEIGPDKARYGGALANIAYFGVPRGGGGSVDIDAPLEAERPRFEKAIRDVLDSLL